MTRLGVPVLTVRGKAEAPYRNILVAADLSEASRRALQAAAALFPAQPLNVLHVYESPLPGGMAEANEHNRKGDKPLDRTFEWIDEE